MFLIVGQSARPILAYVFVLTQELFQPSRSQCQGQGQSAVGMRMEAP